jgi:Ran GTPase-activating protein (RanGAP) involved in mRNA processing and transport
LDGRAEGFAEQIPLLADSPWLSRLRSLEIRLDRLGAEAIKRLCESPHVERLECLALTFGGIDISGVNALVHSSQFPRLRELNLESTDYAAPVGPAFALTLSSFHKPCRLRKLNLEMNRFGPDAAERLAASPALTSLTHLNLRCSSGFMLRETGYRALSESPYLSRIEVLVLPVTEPQLGGIRALTTSPTWRNLRALNLASNRLGPTAGQMIASSPVLEEITILDPHRNKVDDKTAASIAQSPHLTRLCK